MDQSSQNVAWINNSRNYLAYPNFDAIIEFLGQFTTISIFFKKILLILRWSTKHANLGLGGAVSPYVI